MKVCFVIDDMNLSDYNYGGTNHIHDLALHLGKKGIDVTILSFSREPKRITAKFKNALLDTKTIFPIRFIKNAKFIVSNSEFFSEFDIIHSFSWSSIPALRNVSKKVGVPFLFHSLNSLKTNNAFFNTYKKAVFFLFSPDHVAFCDTNSLNFYKKIINKAPSFYLPNPVDVDLFKPVSKEFSNTFLFASSLTEAKGFHDVISAFQQVRSKCSEARLLVAGKGPLIDLAKQTEGVNYLGSFSHKDMNTVYKSADILLNPSYFEGFSLTVLEGLSMGLPTITTRVGGHDILEEQHASLLITPGDVSSLKECMIKLLTKSPLREKLSKNGRDFVVKNNSWMHVVDEVLSVYKTVLSPSGK